MVRVYFHCYPAQPALTYTEVQLSSTIDDAFAPLYAIPDFKKKRLVALKWNPKTSYEKALRDSVYWPGNTTIQEIVDYTGVNLSNPHDLIWIIYGSL
jgi:hypothetical protein